MEATSPIQQEMQGGSMESTGEVDPGTTLPKHETKPANGATSPGEGPGSTQRRRAKSAGGASSSTGEVVLEASARRTTNQQSTVSAAASVRAGEGRAHRQASSMEAHTNKTPAFKQIG